MNVAPLPEKLKKRQCMLLVVIKKRKQLVLWLNLLKGSSLGLSLAFFLRSCSDAPSLYAQPRLRRQPRAGGASLPGRWRPGRRNTNLVLVSKVTQSFVFGATLDPEQRTQNSLFASLISFKGIWTQFWVDRSVSTGEHENMKILDTLPCAFQTRQEGFFSCHLLLFGEICCQ